MIDLITLTKRERIDISLKCEMFFLQFKKVDKFRKLFSTLLKYTAKENAKELWVFITAACRAVRYDSTGSKLPLSKERYYEANKRFKLHISHTRMKNLIADLEGSGFITMYKGFNDGEWSMQSCFIMSPLLLDIIPVDQAKRYALVRQPDEFVKIKDYKKNIFITEYRGRSGIRLLQQQMSLYNKFLEDQEIIIDGRVVRICYVRIFADDLSGAGRYYTSNGFMNEQSDLRKTILINGKSTTEVDMSTIHPRIIATLKGIRLDDNWEPYSVDENVLGALSVNARNQLRKLCKIALMCVLYSENEEKAVKSLYYKFNLNKGKDGKFNLLPITSKEDCFKIINSLKERNLEISDHFFQQGMWKKLQNVDSKICSYIVNHFTKQNQVCLPYHDSWVVTADNREMLIETMENAWVDTFGTKLNFKCEVEF